MPNITLKGIKLFPKKDNQPDFVIASGIITPDDLNAFLIDQDEYKSEYNGAKQFRIQVLKGKDGGPYVVLDTYKPQTASPAPASQQGFPTEELPDTGSLPF